MSDGRSLEVTRVVPASRDRVFEHFTEAGLLAKWWGPRGFSIPAIDFDPRAGAAYRIQMQPPEGEAFHLAGAFREVCPPSRLAFTFVWEPADPDDVETLVELAFRDAGDATEIVLTQGPFKTHARLALHRDGWADSFDRLVEALSEQGEG
jgi:uncharacterized protein YndB with AHSA1/START domain